MKNDELQHQSGLGTTITINGQEYLVKPLTLRQIIALRNYNVNYDKSDLDLNLYAIRLYLRDEPKAEEAMEWLMEMPCSRLEDSEKALQEINRIIKEIDAKLYPPEVKAEEASP